MKKYINEEIDIDEDRILCKLSDASIYISELIKKYGEDAELFDSSNSYDMPEFGIKITRKETEEEYIIRLEQESIKASKELEVKKKKLEKHLLEIEEAEKHLKKLKELKITD